MSRCYHTKRFVLSLLSTAALAFVAGSANAGEENGMMMQHKGMMGKPAMMGGGMQGGKWTEPQNLSEARQRAKQHLDMLNSMTEDQWQQKRAMRDQWQQMTPEQRAAKKQQMTDMKGKWEQMTPEQRAAKKEKMMQWQAGQANKLNPSAGSMSGTTGGSGNSGAASSTSGASE